MQFIADVAELAALYGTPNLASTVKESSILTGQYRRLIEASPFLVLATAGPHGLDCSPRGDAHGLVRIVSDRQLMLPDRRGNNRIDSLRNIVSDPRVALLFLIPGSGTTLRVNGRARITCDADLCASFAIEGQAPRSVIVIDIDVVFFQCARAIVRSRLWEPGAQVDPASLPTPGQILAALSDGAAGGEAYDREWPERARKSLW